MLDAYARSYFEDLKWTLDEIDASALARVVEVFREARDDGRQILLIGNGGSAATASHMACDLGKGTVDPSDPQFRRFRVLSLSDNCALMTALGNDLSFDDVFADQLRIVMREGDVVVLISASGNSPNLVKAHEYARSRGAVTIGLLGFGGGRLRGMVDVPVVVSSRNYGISEDFHLILQHVVTQYLRRAIVGPARPVAFLDRDGIINVRPAPHQYVERWDHFTFADGAVAMLRGLAERGYELVVVTNQQGIGKGVMSAGALDQIHERLKDALATQGVHLAGIFACPHLEARQCFCRKPKPGLIFRALNELGFMVDLGRSIMIGDSEADVEAGRAAGLDTVFVGPGPAPAAAVHGVRRVDAVLDVVTRGQATV